MRSGDRIHRGGFVWRHAFGVASGHHYAGNFAGSVAKNRASGNKSQGKGEFAGRKVQALCAQGAHGFGFGRRRQKLEAYYDKLVAEGLNPVLLVEKPQLFHGKNTHPIGETDLAVAQNLFENLRYHGKTL